MSQPPDFAPLIAAVRSYHQSPPDARARHPWHDRLMPLAGGFHSVVYYCRFDAQDCCIKIHRTDDERQRADREWLALQFLAAHQSGLAPQPYAFSPDPTCPVLVMEYVTGQPLRDLALTANHFAALAQRLTELASLTSDRLTYPHTIFGVPRLTLARLDRWAERLRGGWMPTVAPVVLPILDCWLRSPERTLLDALPHAHFSTGDPNPANWLWDASSGQLRRIDLEYAGWSHPLVDLADFVEGRPWLTPQLVKQLPAFLARFGVSLQDHTGIFAAARRLWAIFWVLKIVEQLERADTADNHQTLQTQIAHATALLQNTTLN